MYTYRLCVKADSESIGSSISSEFLPQAHSCTPNVMPIVLHNCSLECCLKLWLVKGQLVHSSSLTRSFSHKNEISEILQGLVEIESVFMKPPTLFLQMIIGDISVTLPHREDRSVVKLSTIFLSIKICMHTHTHSLSLYTHTHTLHTHTHSTHTL